jgi:hypothetical protein
LKLDGIVFEISAVCSVYIFGWLEGRQVDFDILNHLWRDVFLGREMCIKRIRCDNLEVSMEITEAGNFIPAVPKSWNSHVTGVVRTFLKAYTILSNPFLP